MSDELSRASIDLSPIIQASRKQPNQGDYIQNGLLHCGQCKTAKQTIIQWGGQDVVVGCLCSCGKAQRNKANQDDAQNKERDRIDALRINGIQDKAVRGYTFSNSERTDMIVKAKRYADKWDEMYQKNIGLVMWGNTGNGKTYASACIANELISRGVPVLMTSFPKILDSIQGLYSDERMSYLDSMNKFKLLVIDDLGAERQSEFALQTVYTAIDARYKNGQPIIITTNLTLDDLKNPKNMDYQRIYDRILEMCAPLHFKGESLRKAKASDRFAEAKRIFEED